MSDLAAAELLLILEGGRARGHQAMRLALMELAGRGFIATRREGNVLRRRVYVRRLLSNEHPDREYFKEMLAAAGQGDDLPVRELFERLRERFGSGYGELVSHGVWAEARRRGLVEERQERLLGLIPVKRSRLTPAGEERRAALRRQLAEGSRLPKLLKVSPGEAVVLAASLGPAVLLVPEMRGHFADLNHAMRERADHQAQGDGGAWYWGSVDGADSGLDSLDQSFDAFDSGSSDGGGDGGDGGDGGGGD